MTSNNLRCIYCLERKSVDRFNREHVLPRSMGSFEPHNLIIQPSTSQCCVCESCNSFFGRELDQALARDSFEAVLRFKYGLKSTSKLSELGLKHLTFRLPSTCGDLSGARLRLDIDEDGPIARYLPQVRIRNKKKHNYEFLTIAELSSIAEEVDQYDLRELAIIGQPSPHQERMVQKLREIIHNLGLPFRPGDIENGGIEIIEGIQIISVFDMVMQRAIAKIAFNYLSTALEKVSQHLVYSEDFNVVRNFIRYGAEPGFEVVSISKRNLLSADQAAHGHLVTLEAGRKFGRQMFIGHVALFNTLTWQVILTNDYKGLHYDVDCAHHWDLDRKTCTKIYGLKSNLSFF